jgi:hypothetical protein
MHYLSQIDSYSKPRTWAAAWISFSFSCENLIFLGFGRLYFSFFARFHLIRTLFVFLVFQFKWENMPESRDRLPRPVDYAVVFAQRRAAGTGFILEDQETGPNLFETPIRRVTTATTPATRGQTALGTTRGGGLGRGGFGTPRSMRRRVLYGSPATDQANTPTTSRGSGRGRLRGSVLPSWYPRVPLQEITWVVRDPRVMIYIFLSLLILCYLFFFLVRSWLSYLVKSETS